MAYFNAGSLDNRNVGSRIATTYEGEEIYGVIASVKRRDGLTTVVLTDNMTELKLTSGHSVEIYLSGPDMALIEMSRAMVRLEQTVTEMSGNLTGHIRETRDHRGVERAEQLVDQMLEGVRA